jgi:hypothetical protein
MEWKVLASRLRSILYIRCALTGIWNGRSVNRPGLLLGSAACCSLVLAGVLAFSANFLVNALACLGVGRGERQ